MLNKSRINELIMLYNNVGLNTFFILIFVAFVADGPHFDRIFKMIIILTDSLKWSSFSQFVFYLVIFCDTV